MSSVDLIITIFCLSHLGSLPMLALVWKWRKRGRLYCKDGWVVNEDLGLEAQWWASFLSCSLKR